VEAVRAGATAAALKSHVPSQAVPVITTEVAVPQSFRGDSMSSLPMGGADDDSHLHSHGAALQISPMSVLNSFDDTEKSMPRFSAGRAWPWPSPKSGSGLEAELDEEELTPTAQTSGGTGGTASPLPLSVSPCLPGSKTYSPLPKSQLRQQQQQQQLQQQQQQQYYQKPSHDGTPVKRSPSSESLSTTMGPQSSPWRVSRSASQQSFCMRERPVHTSVHTTDSTFDERYSPSAHFGKAKNDRFSPRPSSPGHYRGHESTLSLTSATMGTTRRNTDFDVGDTAGQSPGVGHYSPVRRLRPAAGGTMDRSSRFKPVREKSPGPQTYRPRVTVLSTFKRS